MNLFGHGIALSSDYFIQGAPSITSKAAGIQSTYDLMNASLPLWIAMSVVTVVTAYILMKKDIKKLDAADRILSKDAAKEKPSFGTVLVSVITPLVFCINTS